MYKRKHRYCAYTELTDKEKQLNKKKQSTKDTNKSVTALLWTIHDLKQTLASSSEVLEAISTTISISMSGLGRCSHGVDSVTNQLTSIRKTASDVVKDATKFLRIPATHAMVFMVSPEERTHKPYATPVQLIPCRGLSDGRVRQLTNAIKTIMVQKEMKVAGR